MDSETFKKMKYSVMDLQCLAAKSVCIRLVREWAEGEMPVIDVWRKGNGYGTCAAHDWFLWQVCEMEVPRLANIPNIIRYQIEDNMALILEQVMIWIQYHHEMKFFHDREIISSSLSEYIVKLVWNRHFRVDCDASAMNILTNENLSPFERFRFASTYCIVEEIEKFRDAIDLVSEWYFIKDPFVMYWSRYLKNELHTISVPEDSTLDAMMLTKALDGTDLWLPVVYFFDKLDSASKCSRFERIVELCGKKYLNDLLAKLTDKEWNLACRPAISKIVEKIVEWGALDDVRYIWNLFRSKMNSTNFCGILETLIPESMRNASNFEKWTPLLMEIWTSASSRFKQSAIDVKLWLNIGEKCILHIIPTEETSDFRARRQISDPMKFFKMVLKSTNVKKRTAFFEKNFYWLIIWAPFDEVDKLMREFLERYNRDVVKMKKDIANSSEIERSLLVLLGFGEFDEFDAVSSFYMPGIGSFIKDDDDEMRMSLVFYKWALIMNTAGLNSLSICIYFADWRSLYEYAKKIISLGRVSIAPDAFMITLIEMGWFQGIHNLLEKLVDGQMRDLKECLSAILSPTDHRLKGLKKRIKDHMFKTLFDCECNEKRIFKRTDVQDFLLWIYDGDEDSLNKNFKQPHLFPKGFLVHLKFCFTSGGYGPFRASESMEEFLQWCFETEAERRQFKRDMIYKFRHYKIIEDLLTRRRYRRSMLFWFFDGDVGAIEKFTNECGHDPVFTSGGDDLKVELEALKRRLAELESLL